MDWNTFLVSCNSVLLAIVGFFLVRFMQHADKSSEALIEVASQVKVLIVNLQNDKEALERHEERDEKEHERFRSDIEALARRDHDLADTITSLWASARHEHGWDLPEHKPMAKRTTKQRG